MKKVLIISYHSLPYNVIASYRANAYLKHFGTFGIEPILLTHFLGMKEETEVMEEKYDYGTVIRIPIKQTLLAKLVGTIESISLINKVSILIRWIAGYLDSSPIDINSYFSLKSFAINYLKTHKIDLVISIFSPHHHLRIAYKINRRFGIPYVLDFRDLWNNRVIHEAYSPGLIERMQDFITIHYWQKWLSNSRFFTITSNAWKIKINTFSSKEGFVVKNGFEKEYFNDLKVHHNSDEFILLYTGSLYSHQKIDIFLQGCQEFIKQEKPSKFKVKFVGSDRSYGKADQLSGFLFQPKNKIHEVLPEKYCEVTKRIPKEELAILYQEATLLLLLSWPNAPGTYSGKIFDYLGVKKPILVVPGDGSVVSDLIIETEAGVIKNTPEEVKEYLTKAYSFWEKNRKLRYMGNSKIENYSRIEQTRLMCKLLLSELSK